MPFPMRTSRLAVGLYGLAFHAVVVAVVAWTGHRNHAGIPASFWLEAVPPFLAAAFAVYAVVVAPYIPRRATTRGAVLFDSAVGMFAETAVFVLTAFLYGVVATAPAASEGIAAWASSATSTTYFAVLWSFGFFLRSWWSERRRPLGGGPEAARRAHAGLKRGVPPQGAPRGLRRYPRIDGGGAAVPGARRWRAPAHTRLAGRSGLRGDAGAVAEAVAELSAAGIDGVAIARLVARLNDALVRRLLRRAEADLGAPPAPYAWVVFGSQGRMEQTLLTDQDDLLAYADEGERSRGWFRALAERVNGDLEAAGLPRCSGGHMARENLAPISEWRRRFDAAVDGPRPTTPRSGSTSGGWAGARHRAARGAARPRRPGLLFLHFLRGRRSRSSRRRRCSSA
jgi:hypothetical protein